MRVETSFTATFIDSEEQCDDVAVSCGEGRVFITQSGDCVAVPLSEAIAFADALKTWIAEQS